MKTIFEVYGPFAVPYHQGKGGRTIRDEDIKAFWGKYKFYQGHHGCYIFANRAGKGMTPGYVGRATKSFKGEAFAHHKLSCYQQFLADYKKGTPVIFFLTPPPKKGKPDLVHIKQLESFLIQVGVATNPDLLNIKGTKVEEWGIKGILRSGKGKPSPSARQFRDLMKFA